MTATEYFATFGLGGLVGLSAKDVVEKLISALKTWLRVEEPEVQDIKIKPEDGGEVAYGGKVIKFRVDPQIPVTWTIDPPDAGTIINGFFRPTETPRMDTVTEQHVVITATSKADSDRYACATITVKKNL